MGRQTTYEMFTPISISKRQEPNHYNTMSRFFNQSQKLVSPVLQRSKSSSSSSQHPDSNRRSDVDIKLPSYASVFRLNYSDFVRDVRAANSVDSGRQLKPEDFQRALQTLFTNAVGTGKFKLALYGRLSDRDEVGRAWKRLTAQEAAYWAREK